MIITVVYNIQVAVHLSGHIKEMVSHFYLVENKVYLLLKLFLFTKEFYHLCITVQMFVLQNADL